MVENLEEVLNLRVKRAILSINDRRRYKPYLIYSNLCILLFLLGIFAHVLGITLERQS